VSSEVDARLPFFLIAKGRYIKGLQSKYSFGKFWTVFESPYFYFRGKTVRMSLIESIVSASIRYKSLCCQLVG
jgi:hypothetical protein